MPCAGARGCAQIACRPRTDSIGTLTARLCPGRRGMSEAQALEQGLLDSLEKIEALKTQLVDASTQRELMEVRVCLHVPARACECMCVCVF